MTVNKKLIHGLTLVRPIMYYRNEFGQIIFAVGLN